MTGLAAHRSNSAADRLAKRARSVRRRPWRLAGYAVLAVGAIAGLVWALWFSSLVAVRHVQVVGLDGADKAAVEQLSTAAMGVPLMRVDVGTLETQIRSRVTIAEATVTRQWPDTLVVHAAPRVAAVVISMANGSLHVVDATGVDFGIVATRPANVPLVTADGGSDPTTPGIASALSVVASLHQVIDRPVNDIRVSPSGLVTFTLARPGGTTTVVWGGPEAGNRKARIIKALLPGRPTLIDVSAPDTPVTR